MLRALPFCFVFGTVSFFTHAKLWEAFHHTYSYQYGLPGMSIYDLQIDTRGAMYLATDKGVFFFNGVLFRKIPAVGGLSLPVTSLRESSTGELYCKSFGSELFLIDGDSVRQITTPKPFNRLQEIAIVHDTLTLVYPKEVWLLHPKSGYQRKLYQHQSTKYEELFDVVWLKDTMWIAASNQLIGLASDGGIVSKRAPSGEKYFNRYQNEIYYAVRNGEKGAYALHGKEAYRLPLGIAPIYLRSAGQHHWLCSNAGLFQLSGDESLLKELKVSDIAEDHTGTLWISTVGHGLYVIPDQELKQNQLLVSGAGETMKRIEANDLGVWIGTSIGRIWYLTPEGSLKNILGERSDIEISALYIQENGKLWSTVGCWDMRTNARLSRTFLGNYIRNDPFGRLLVSYHAGLGIVPNQTPPEKFVSLPKVANSSNDESQFVKILLGNRRARCADYIPLLDGYLVGFHDKAELFTWENHQTFNTPDSTPLILNDIAHEQGTLWLATANEGVWRLNHEGWKQFDTREGLLNNTVKRLRLENGGVWLLTEYGVQYINNKDQVEGVGFPFSAGTTEVYDFALLHGNVWLVSSKGLLKYPGNKFNSISDLNPCFITVMCSNNPIQNGDVLFFENRKIRIQFDAFLLNSNGLFDYYYRLLGADTSWISASANNNIVRYEALPPGTYQFEVRSKQGLLYSPVSSFRFSILRPWWSTWWFYTGMIGFFVLSIVAVYKITLYYNTKRLLQKQLLLKSQLTALRAQMNPHFLYNVLNAVQGMIYSNKKVEAGDYLGKFSELMRKALDHSDKQFTSLKQELEMIHLYLELEAGRFEHDLRYIIEVDPNIDTAAFELPTMLIQPFIENAMKHGLLHKKGEKKLEVKFKKMNEGVFNSIRVEITDNGIGREASRQLQASKVNKSASFAVNATQGRIDLLNKQFKRHISLEIIDLYHDTSVPAGTKVLLIIPPLFG